MSTAKTVSKTLEKTAEITISHAKQAELYPIYILSNEYFQYANFSFAEIKRRVDSGTVVYLVARIGGKMAGYLDFELHEDHAKILGVAVLKESRNKGVGTALVKHAVEDIQKRNYTRAYLFVAKDNLEAQKIYAKAGFVCAGQIPKKINDQDVLLFQQNFEPKKPDTRNFA